MNLYNEAIQTFLRHFNRLRRSGVDEPTAMIVATTHYHHPSARVMLLKEATQAGFVFYTNRLSRKGQELKRNPHVALVFYWPSLHMQVRVSGRVKPVSVLEADAYWVTRPRVSQIGAWASQQSDTLAKRSVLLSRVKMYAKMFRHQAVPRPPYWTGFRVEPSCLEFWKRRPYRLHERTLYDKVAGRWRKRLLYP